MLLGRSVRGGGLTTVTPKYGLERIPYASAAGQTPEGQPSGGVPYGFRPRQRGGSATGSGRTP